jgi:HlyD family secretion protein
VAPPLTDARERAILRARLDAAAAGSQAARAEVGRAAAVLAQARREAQRTENLAEAGFVSPAARDLASTAVRQHEQVLAIADGQARVAEQAGPVAAGQALVEIGDIHRLEAVIDLLSADAMLVAPGARVELRAGETLPPFAGTVLQIEPVAFTRLSALGIEEQRVNVIVALDPPAAGAPGPGDGFRVDARIAVARREAALLVPVAALARTAEAGWAVYRLEGGRARRVAIALLERNPEQARIDGPLSAGQAVILYPGPKLRDGDRVRPIARNP